MSKTRSLINKIALITAVAFLAILGVFVFNVYIWSTTVREVYFPQEIPNKNGTIDERIVNEARELLLTGQPGVD